MNTSTFASAYAPAIHEVGASRAVGPRAHLGELRIRRDVKSLSERFWAKVDKNGPTMPHMQTQCWVWTAGCIGDGYGRFRIRRKGTLAHRVAWLIHYGCIPDGLCVLHRCDNPPCVRDDHLFLGTKADNAHDRDIKGRHNGGRGDRHGLHLHPESRATGERNGSHVHPECVCRGERNGRAKLNEEKVKRVFQLHCEGWTQKGIANELGVGRSIIGYILSRKKWAHVQLGAST